MADDDAVPFRWNVARREQLGRLAESPRPPSSPSWYEDMTRGRGAAELRLCAARVLARAGDARLVFVGRSPENLFDYLSGALSDTAWNGRCALLTVSLRRTDRPTPPAVQALRAHLRAVGLAPRDIASGPPVAFVDLLYGGYTFGRLSDELCGWARDEGTDVNAVRRRLRFVGITEQGKNSPNAWRWFQRLPWTADYPRSALRGVSVPYWFWTYLGDIQDKTIPSHPMARWGGRDARRPPRDPAHLAALAQAARIHEHGRTREERGRLATELSRRPEMREPWLRSLVIQLRR